MEILTRVLLLKFLRFLAFHIMEEQQLKDHLGVLVATYIQFKGEEILLKVVLSIIT